MIKKIKLIILLISFVFIFKSNSSSLHLVINSNVKNNIKNGDECGTISKPTCNNINEALAYFTIFLNEPKNQNMTYNLFLELVDGIYLANDNSLEFVGWNVYLSPNNSSKNVTINGSGSKKPFITIYSDYMNKKNTNLFISDINFENFNSQFYYSQSDSILPTKIYIDFSSCKFLNSGQSDDLYFSGINYDNLSNYKNSIYFYECYFENIIFKNNAFNFQNYYISIYGTKMNSIIVRGGLYIDLLGSNILSIFYSSFVGINFNGFENLLNIKSGTLSIVFSTFDNIKSSSSSTSSNNYLIYGLNNPIVFEIIKSNFTNIDCNFIYENGGNITIFNNIISSSKSNIISFGLINSNIKFGNNTMLYPNYGGVINCDHSTINIINDKSKILNNYPCFPTCKLIYNDNHSNSSSDSCSSTTSIDEETSSNPVSTPSNESGTTSGKTTTSTTTIQSATSTSGNNHTNGSNHYTTISYWLMKFILIIILIFL
ncbi:hypothetical protein ACTA71_011206 [Dictyostelium dimigraforme]